MFLIALVGIFVCRKGVKQGAEMYRYGLWFFLLILISQIIALVQVFLMPVLIAAAETPGQIKSVLFAISSLHVLTTTPAFVILVWGFFRSLPKG